MILLHLLRIRHLLLTCLVLNFSYNTVNECNWLLYPIQDICVTLNLLADYKT